MAHEVESMFSVREMPWHKLGKILTDNPTVEEGLIAAGLNWEVTARPTYTEYNNTRVPCTNQAIIRLSDGALVGEVGPDYEILQNRQAFLWFQPFLDSGMCKLETAGSLRGGKRIWIMAVIKDDPFAKILPGDDIIKYLLLSHSHDGTMPVVLGYSPTRVVCANTLRMAIEHRSGKLIRLLHTKGVHQSMEKVRDCIDLANRSFATTAAVYRELAQHTVNQADLEKYIRVVMEVPKENQEKSRVFQKVSELHETGVGSDIKGVQGSYWGLYNAVTEYITHHKGSSNDIRMDSNWFGPNATINAKALKTAIDMASGKHVEEPQPKISQVELIKSTMAQFGATV